MRKKYLPIYVAALFLTALGVMGFCAYGSLASPKRVTRISSVKPIVTPTVPDQETFAAMMKLQDQLGTLARTVPGKPEPVNLRLFGYVPVRPMDLRKGDVGPGLQSGDTHFLTMAFRGMTKGFCVIDGTFYAQGASLPDGSLIRRVEHSRVLLVKMKRKVWLKMAKAGPIQEQEARKTGETK
jgi:hypothetical protein